MCKQYGTMHQLHSTPSTLNHDDANVTSGFGGAVDDEDDDDDDEPMVNDASERASLLGDAECATTTTTTTGETRGRRALKWVLSTRRRRDDDDDDDVDAAVGTSSSSSEKYDEDDGDDGDARWGSTRRDGWTTIRGERTRRVAGGAAIAVGVVVALTMMVSSSSSSRWWFDGVVGMGRHHRGAGTKTQAAALSQAPVRLTNATVQDKYASNAQGKVDKLALAAALDPVHHSYLPDAFNGYDPTLPYDKYAHKPVVSGSDKGFSVCFDVAKQHWDAVYATGFGLLFEPGLCFQKVESGNCETSKADVRIFSESAYLWGGRHKTKGGAYDKPAKVHPKQVDFYFAHEAAGTFGGDLRRPDVLNQFDYLGYFDNKKSAVWWPFGPTLNSLVHDFPAHTTPFSERIPGLAWIAIDCLPPRSSLLVRIADHFPVFSMGSCKHNAPAPKGLPSRGNASAKYQELMAKYMFYFAMENAPACAGYATEKIWMALARGSIPVYMGAEDIEELMPAKNAFVDMRKFDSPEALGEELRSIARDEAKYKSYTQWRYEDPHTWQPGFRKLLRVMSSDVKMGPCAVLQKGESTFPKAFPQTGSCDGKYKALGLSSGQIAGVPNTPRNPFDFLDKKCDELDAKCYKWRSTPLGEPLVKPSNRNKKAAVPAAAATQQHQATDNKNDKKDKNDKAAQQAANNKQPTPKVEGLKKDVKKPNKPQQGVGASKDALKKSGGTGGTGTGDAPKQKQQSK